MVKFSEVTKQAMIWRQLLLDDLKEALALKQEGVSVGVLVANIHRKHKCLNYLFQQWTEEDNFFVIERLFEGTDYHPEDELNAEVDGLADEFDRADPFSTVELHEYASKLKEPSEKDLDQAIGTLEKDLADSESDLAVSAEAMEDVKRPIEEHSGEPLVESDDKKHEDVLDNNSDPYGSQEDKEQFDEDDLQLGKSFKSYDHEGLYEKITSETLAHLNNQASENVSENVQKLSAEITDTHVSDNEDYIDEGISEASSISEEFPQDDDVEPDHGELEYNPEETEEIFSEDDFEDDMSYTDDDDEAYNDDDIDI